MTKDATQVTDADHGGAAADRRAAAAPDGPPSNAPGPLLTLIHDQRIAFLMVGGVNTLVGYGLFVLFDFTVGSAVEARLGSTVTSDVVLLCAHVVSVLVAFVLYRRLVFRVRGRVWRDLARFESVYLVAIGVNLVLLPLLVGVFGLPRLLAQALIVVVTTAISYFGHREFSFRRSAEIDHTGRPADAGTGRPIATDAALHTADPEAD